MTDTDKDRIEGGFDKAKGSVKEEIGELRGDDRQVAESTRRGIRWGVDSNCRYRHAVTRCHESTGRRQSAWFGFDLGRCQGVAELGC